MHDILSHVFVDGTSVGFFGECSIEGEERTPVDTFGQRFAFVCGLCDAVVFGKNSPTSAFVGRRGRRFSGV